MKPNDKYTHVIVTHVHTRQNMLSTQGFLKLNTIVNHLIVQNPSYIPYARSINYFLIPLRDTNIFCEVIILFGGSFSIRTI